jgi:hypothetical protein
MVKGKWRVGLTYHGWPTLLLEPRNGRMADAISPTDLSQGLSIRPSRQGLSDLELRELRLPAKPYSPRYRSLPSFIGSGKDHQPFKFGESAKHSQGQFSDLHVAALEFA